MEPQVGKNRIIAEFRASPRGLRWPPHHEPGQVPFWVVLPTKVCGRTQGKIAGPGSLQDSQVLSILNLELYSAVPNALVTQNIRPGSKVEAGLGNRRQDEAYLWVTGIYRAHGHVIP